MPSTFQFHKPVEDMEEAVLLPEDWMDVEIKNDPKILMNKKLRDALDNPEDPSETEVAEALESVEGAGYNLHMWLVTEHPEDRFCGHELQIWLPFPTEKDEFEYRKGQNRYTHSSSYSTYINTMYCFHLSHTNIHSPQFYDIPLSTIL